MEKQAKRFHSSIDYNLDKFDTVSLSELNNKAGLMKRVDNKFLLSIHQLERIFPVLSSYFSVLEIEGQVNHSYSSKYFDTANFDMYMKHHNRKLNRFKIRQRRYHTNNQSFLEVKYKTNKGETRKTRIQTTFDFNTIPPELFDFIKKHTPFQPIELRKTLDNEFLRFTLVNQLFTQRITIDTNLQIINKHKRIIKDKVVIAEVKSDRSNIDKTIFQLFKANGIKPSGMSKYSIGMAMLQDNLKQNLFKQKIHTIEKINRA